MAKLFSDQIKRCIDECGMSRYAIAKKTGLAQATLSRFMNGTGGMSVDGLDRLAACIGMVARLASTASTSSQKATKGKAR